MAIRLLPSEVWELILEKLDDSKDVLNAFEAYPELEEEGVLRSKRQLWLFDQIIPHIFTWLKQKEVLACRQVCKQWSRAVDNFLENHPSKRAYDHGTKLTGQQWIPRASSAHYDLKNYFGSSFRTDGLLFNGKNFAKSLLDMDSHPPERNPFVGRSIWIEEPGLDKIEAFWKLLQEILRKFGKHVWFLSIKFRRVGTEFSRFCQLLLNVLSFVPNLKSLKIDSHYGLLDDKNKIKGSPEFLKQPFPPLAQLESVSFQTESDTLPQFFIDYFVTGYSSQIRRLDMKLSYWRKEYSKLIPNLTELFLDDPIEEVIQLLSTFDSPKLYHLNIRVSSEVTATETFKVSRIIKCLMQFPTLNSLYLGVRLCSSALTRVEELAPLSFSTVAHPSLKSVGILMAWRDRLEVNERLLRYFPNVEYLRLHAKKELDILWELLPKLREITLEGGKRTSYWRPT